MNKVSSQASPIEPLQLEIIARDQTLVAINKPAGLLVHRSAIDYHEPHNAQDLLTLQITSAVFPVHRLDKPTSGVLLFALNNESASMLAQKFQNHEIHKEYIAVVRGHSDDSGAIDNPVRDKDAPKKPRKPAVTRYQTLARITLPFAVDQYPEARYSLVKLHPQSGRRHQIRLHMKHISHPIIGDTSYGKTVHNRFFNQHLQCARLLLHANRLSFTHPLSGEKISLLAACDEQFKQIISLPQWQWIDRADISGLQQYCRAAKT